MAELDEKFAAHVDGMGQRRARRWYRAQVMGTFHPRLWLPAPPRPAGPSPTRGRASLAFNLLRDLRIGLRMLARAPALTLVIVVTLAVGLGFNGAIFSLVNTIIRNELPIAEPHRVLFLDSDNRSQDRESLRLSWLDYRDFAAAAGDSFDAIAAFHVTSVNLGSSGAPPERFEGSVLEPSLFDVLGVQPQLGRRFGPADAVPGAESVVLIGYDVWQTRFGGNADVVGRTVQVNARPAVIIGVLPARLQPTPFAPAVWMPLQATERMLAERDRRFLRVAGRLAPAATQEAAALELQEVAARLARDHPATNEGVGVVVGTFQELYTETANRTITLVMMGAALFLLLIACANVANLLVSRSIQRHREVVIRAALGASRWRVIQQLLVESLLLSLGAAVLGAALAVWGAGLLERAIRAAAPPEYWDFSVRPSVFVVIVGLSLLTTLIFGLVPAFQATRRELAGALRHDARSSGGGGSRRLSGALVVAQVALSLVLLAGAGVMVRSTLNTLDVDWIVDPEDVLSVRLTLSEGAYPERDNLVAFHDELERRLLSLPGIDDVALTSSFPSEGGFTVSAEIEGFPLAEGHPAATVTQLIVSPDYFDLAGLEPVRGRLLDDRDRFEHDLVVVVEQRFAERYWPGQDPLGKSFRWVGETETRWIEVVGVVQDVTQMLELGFMPDYPLAFTPYRQEPLRSMGLMVSSPLDPGTLAALLRAEVHRLDDDLPLYGVAPLQDVIDERTLGMRIVSVLFLLLGGIALFLACIGIYAVTAFAVGTRRREIGIRLALGARSSEIIGLVSRASLLQTALGLLLGLAGAFALMRVISIFMYRVSATDPLTFGLVLLLLVLTAAVAGIVPARRASRVDPVRVLRVD